MNWNLEEALQYYKNQGAPGDQTALTGLLREVQEEYGGAIPGIRPGRATAEFLDDLMTKITLIGGSGLLVVALIPMLLTGIMEVPWVIASFFGGTSLLIIVGVALDTLRVMESHLLVRKYEGFLSHGTLRGRGGV